MSDSIGGFVVNVVAGVTQAIQKAINDAYERGVADGKRQASAEIRERLEKVISSDIVLEQQSAIISFAPLNIATPARSSTEKRSPRGSVEPAVLDALQNSGKGKKPSEIAAEKGIPENSVRGTLNKLRNTGQVVKRRDLWFPVRVESNDFEQEKRPTNDPFEDLLS